MGGFLILLALSISTLLWADLTNPYVWVVLLVTVGFGLIGFFDDYRKLTRTRIAGCPAGPSSPWNLCSAPRPASPSLT